METTYKIINSYSVAFLGYYLKGQKEYLSFLNQNHWPAVMTWEAKGEVALTNGRGEKAAGSKQE
jgi:hypothetical protein